MGILASLFAEGARARGKESGEKRAAMGKPKQDAAMKDNRSK